MQLALGPLVHRAIRAANEREAGEGKGSEDPRLECRERLASGGIEVGCAANATCVPSAPLQEDGVLHVRCGLDGHQFVGLEEARSDLRLWPAPATDRRERRAANAGRCWNQHSQVC